MLDIYGRKSIYGTIPGRYSEMVTLGSITRRAQVISSGDFEPQIIFRYVDGSFWYDSTLPAEAKWICTVTPQWKREECEWYLVVDRAAHEGSITCVFPGEWAGGLREQELTGAYGSLHRCDSYEDAVEYRKEYTYARCSAVRKGTYCYSHNPNA